VVVHDFLRRIVGEDVIAAVTSRAIASAPRASVASSPSLVPNPDDRQVAPEDLERRSAPYARRVPSIEPP
jgi:hypothetical protein